MKQISIALYSRMILYILCCTFLVSSITGCKKESTATKEDNVVSSSNSSDVLASQYSSDVIDKWITMQLRLMRDVTGIANVAFSRYYAYSGIAALESLVPGLPGKYVLSNKWNGLTGLPVADVTRRYYWPASVNAALASMNRNIFTTASSTDKAAIDSLEKSLNDSYLLIRSQAMIDKSNAFGKAVGDAVYNWSQSDGYLHASDSYTPPVGPGLWIPTPPAFAPASTPYWGNNRTLVDGSINNTQPSSPIAYSEDPKSPFYKMVNQVYTASQNLTTDETNMALFWKDIPGYSSPGHWLSILQQVIAQTKSQLDKAALAYAVTGTCLSDACISCWKAKYMYNRERPITYIQQVMGYTSWASLLTTPAHPEYPSAHAVLSASTADAFTSIFPNIGSFTDHTYDYMGLPARTYNSFRAIGEEAGRSRFYAGIHYKPSIDTGLIQGRKVATNILGILRME